MSEALYNIIALRDWEKWYNKLLSISGIISAAADNNIIYRNFEIVNTSAPKLAKLTIHVIHTILSSAAVAGMGLGELIC